MKTGVGVGGHAAWAGCGSMRAAIQAKPSPTTRTTDEKQEHLKRRSNAWHSKDPTRGQERRAGATTGGREHVLHREPTQKPPRQGRRVDRKRQQKPARAKRNNNKGTHGEDNPPTHTHKFPLTVVDKYKS